MILTNNFKLSLWEGSSFPCIKIQMPTGILWQVSKSLFQIVPLHSLSWGILIRFMKKSNTILKDELQGERASFTFLSKKRCYGMQRSWCHHTNTEMVVGFEDLFPIFTVNVQATYTHLQLLMPSCNERYLHIPLILVISFIALFFISLWLRKGKWQTLTCIWDNAQRHFMKLMFLTKLCSTQGIWIKSYIVFWIW